MSSGLKTHLGFEVGYSLMNTLLLNVQVWEIHPSFADEQARNASFDLYCVSSSAIHTVSLCPKTPHSLHDLHLCLLECGVSEVELVREDIGTR